MKASSVDTSILDEIAFEIKDYSKNVSKYSAIAASNELVFASYDAIEKFYDDYEPEYYDRHYTNFLKRSYKKYYHNNRDTVFSGGVELSSDFLKDLYRGSTELVFNLVIMTGAHGLDAWNQQDIRPSNPYKRMSPPPIELITMERDYIYKNPNKCIRAGIKGAAFEAKGYRFL